MGLTKLNAVTEELVKVDIDKHPLFAKLWAGGEVTRIHEGDMAAFRQQPGLTMLCLVDDPVRFKETFDMVVLAPEIKKLFAGTLTDCGFTDPLEGRKIASQLGLHRLPAIAIFRFGEMMGAIEGLRTWQDYEKELIAILTAQATPKKKITIGVS